MPKLKENRVPALRRHASGSGVVRLSGKDTYLGPWGTPECDANYRRAVAGWLANGREAAPGGGGGIAVGELARRFAAHAEAAYRKRGQPTTWAKVVGVVMRDLDRLYGGLPAAEFGPLALQTLRHSWVEPWEGTGRTRGVCRKTANDYAAAVVLAYRWGVAQELLDPAALERLRAVAGLRRGSGGAKEGRSVQPVSAGDFERTVEVLPPTAAAVARLQWWTGMRPGEACRMRAGDVDRAGDVWVYAVRPDANKAEHRGRSRQVMIGPRGREVLRPWLDAQPDPEGYVFRPRGGRRAYYYPRAYWNEVSKACRKAGVGPWHPNRIRHAFARRVATEHGIEAARILMGHATEAMTMHYAKLAPATAARVAAASG